MNNFELTVISVTSLSHKRREIWWCDAWVDDGFCCVWREVGHWWDIFKLHTTYTPDADGDVGIAMFGCKYERLPELYSVNANGVLKLE